MNTNKSLRISIFLIIAAMVFIRTASLRHENADTDVYLQWYSQIETQGLSKMADNYSVYTPPYLYLLWLATLTRNVIPPLMAIKLIPTVFDLLSAFGVYKLIRLKYSQGDVPYLAAAVFLLLPTILVNSTYWGQVDSPYTSFLLLCIFFLLTGRPFYAMLMFGIAVSIKAQSVFLIPFLGILAFKKRIPWLYFLIPPLIYLIMITPAVLAGMPFMDALLIYLAQAKAFGAPSMNAPNFYSLVIYPPYYMDWNTAINIGSVIAAISIISWTVIYIRRKYELNQKVMLLSILTGFALIPFVLPKMHDRYFYPADALSLVFAFYYPTYWFVPLLFQAGSGIMYYVFLGSVQPVWYPILFPMSAIFIMIAVVTLLVKQHRETTQPLKEQHEP
ncbi:MAG: hypothetical protein K8S20_10135 [Chloroflexi bacterium]|nr:hypothetical protein [Chloroflexota bacterium]